jgi:tRNA G18 (ribose-2'-O)-methylase SpoU
MIPKLFVCLDNIRSAYNVGSILRTCETAAVTEIFFIGFTPPPTHPKVKKTALNSQLLDNWRVFSDVSSFITYSRQHHLRLISLESDAKAASIYQTGFESDTCLVLGNEVTGVSPEFIQASDLICQIPMYGQKESLNVSVAAGIAIYEFKRKVLSGSVV